MNESLTGLGFIHCTVFVAKLIRAKAALLNIAVIESLKLPQIVDVHDAVRVQVDNVEEMIQAKNCSLSTFPCWLVMESRKTS